ncbi:MAG: ATP-dependent Clp protease ATP-binding subunit [Polyangiaceae bacterium]
MTTSRSPAELVALRKAAQELSTQRRERLSTIHLLAVAARAESPAAELFADRRLDQEAILKAARGISDEGPEAIGRAMTAAREIAKRSATPEPSAVHLVLALLADRSCAALRALTDLGVDAGRLRASAMALAQGVVAARRPSAHAPLRSPSLGDAPTPMRSMSITELHTRRTPEPPSASSSTSAARASSGKTPAAKSPSISNSSPPPPRSVTSPGVTVPLLPPLPPLVAKRPAPRTDTITARADAKLAHAPEPEVAPAKAGAPVIPLPKRPGQSAPRLADPARFALDKERFPMLSALGKNLTQLAAEGTLRPAIGRSREIEGVLDVLAKRHASSACIVGPAGVGKTTVVHGVAHRMVALAAAGEPPRAVIELSVPQLMAGTGLRGALAEKVAAMCAETRESEGSVVVFFDEVHELFGPATEEATATLKLALARGEVQLVGATTPEEYRKSIEADPALARRFSLIEVEEPSEAESVPLLAAVAEELGRHHRATYEEDAIAAAASWCARYLPGRALPDKAIHVLDLAGARVRRRAEGRVHSGKVAMSDVAGVVAELCDVPRERLLETDGERMLALESLLAERVVGHGEALAKIARVLRRNAAGMRGRRPIGSFLLLGPTGVGKTETAKAIAEALFHSPDAMTRLDLSEFAEAHALARLVGAPPGYVGHEAGGQLTEAVRKRPYQVVLLDEIEKAHRDVLLTFLQVLDEGRLTDGRGRRVDFTNTVIVLTSNLGAAEAGAAAKERTVGFGRPSSPTKERLADVVIGAARGALAPELYNRIDEVLCFAPLTRAEVAEVARRMLAELGRSLGARGIRLDVEPRAVEALLDAGGFDASLGARPMRRTIGRLVEAPLAEMILRGDLAEGSVALLDVEDGAIVVDAVAARAAE